MAELNIKWLEKRSKMLQTIRAYFAKYGFIEVHTPVRVPTPCLEDHIDAIPSGEEWLRTSPELHMKRMIASGMKRIYQIGPCFRAGERGKRHRPEFTMLEWYQADADYRDLLNFTREMVLFCAHALKVDPPEGWFVQGVDEAFQETVGISAQQACREGRFEQHLIDTVEPALGDNAVFLIDYPVELGALARCTPDDPETAERWELYINGLEIANTYSELTDPVEQRRRFEQTAILRESDGRETYTIDEDFLEVLSKMPPTAGSALGIDRLLMALLDIDDIGEIIAFSE